jgi:GNAT superfamily N-acetyltransferase
MRVHAVQASEWEEYREIRLAALKDSPSAFAATWQQEAGYPAERWKMRAQLSQDGVTRIAVVAVEGRQWIGLAGGYRPGDRAADAELISMWVTAGYRGHGVGRALVGAILSWAEGHRACDIGLWVNKANRPAINLYQSTGFRPTGEFNQLPSDHDQQEIRMLALVGPSAGQRRIAAADK